MFYVRDVSGQHSVMVNPGTLLIEVLASAGLMSADAPCGHKGICKKCRVKIRHDDEWIEVLACQTSVISDLEVDCLSINFNRDICVQVGYGKRVRLATRVRKVLVDSFSNGMTLCWEQCCSSTGIAIGQGKPANVGILRGIANYYYKKEAFTAVVSGDEIIGLETGDTQQEFYGMAFDIGTTTVVGYLLNMRTGEQLCAVSSLNDQVKYGADLVTRITLAESSQIGLERLRSAIVECVDNLIGEATHEANIQREAIYDLALVSNPCMQHLFLGIQPAGLGKAPYQPILREALTLNAHSMGLCVNAVANVYWLPGIAGFVGSDTVGMIVSQALYQEEQVTLALDIGTNGEMVLTSAGELWACSTAAGPAFEGTSMSCGMRAQNGAIDKVWIEDGNLFYNVIGDVKPLGLCGSGIVDAIGAMLRAGLIDESGRFVSSHAHESLAARFNEKDGQRTFLVVDASRSADGREIVLSQKDIRELQLAKAAITAGVRLLISEARLRLHDIQRVILAGAFGLYLSLESIRTIGLIPEILCDKIELVGNAAGLGAQNALLSEPTRQLAVEAAKRIHYVELAGSMDFTNIYIDELTFPKQ